MITPYIFQQFVKGDERALTILYKKYKPILLKAYWSLPIDMLSKNVAINSAWIQIWNNRQAITSPEMLHNYLMTTIRFCLLDEYRKLKKYYRNTEPDTSIISDLEYHIDFPDERIKTIRRYMTRLTPIQQDVLTAYYFHDVGLRCFAMTHNRNLHTVKNHFKAGLDKLKEICDKKGNK